MHEKGVMLSTWTKNAICSVMDRHKEGLQAPSGWQRFLACLSDQLDTSRILIGLSRLDSDAAPLPYASRTVVL